MPVEIVTSATAIIVPSQVDATFNTRRGCDPEFCASQVSASFHAMGDFRAIEVRD